MSSAGFVARRLGGREEEVYVGEVDRTMKAQGIGVLFRGGKRVYEGEFRAGRVDGIGEWVEEGKCQYYGQLKEAKPHGVGHLKEPAKEIMGNFQYGTPFGVAMAKGSNGLITKGIFKNGLLHGFCFSKSHDTGYAYKGFCLAGKRDGPGVEANQAEGIHYQGQQVKDVKHGIGLYTVENGKAHTETLSFWDQDSINKYVIEEDRLTGTRYEGQAFEGQKSGACRVKSSNFSYVGEVLEGFKHGYGRYEDDRQVFTGNWEADRRTGLGLAVNKADGSSYFGTWRYDKKEGFGVLRRANEVIPQMYKEGRLVDKVGEKISVLKDMDLLGFNRQAEAKLKQINGTVDFGVQSLERAYSILDLEFEADAANLDKEMQRILVALESFEDTCNDIKQRIADKMAAFEKSKEAQNFDNGPWIVREEIIIEDATEVTEIRNPIPTQQPMQPLQSPERPIPPSPQQPPVAEGNCSFVITRMDDDDDSPAAERTPPKSKITDADFIPNRPSDKPGEERHGMTHKKYMEAFSRQDGLDGKRLSASKGKDNGSPECSKCLGWNVKGEVSLDYQCWLCDLEKDIARDPSLHGVRHHNQPSQPTPYRIGGTPPPESYTERNRILRDLNKFNDTVKSPNTVNRFSPQKLEYPETNYQRLRADEKIRLLEQKYPAMAAIYREEQEHSRQWYKQTREYPTVLMQSRDDNTLSIDEYMPEDNIVADRQLETNVPRLELDMTGRFVGPDQELSRLISSTDRVKADELSRTIQVARIDKYPDYYQPNNSRQHNVYSRHGSPVHPPAGSQQSIPVSTQSRSVDQVTQTPPPNPSMSTQTSFLYDSNQDFNPKDHVTVHNHSKHTGDRPPLPRVAPSPTRQEGVSPSGDYPSPQVNRHTQGMRTDTPPGIREIHTVVREGPNGEIVEVVRYERMGNDGYGGYTPLARSNRYYPAGIEGVGQQARQGSQGQPQINKSSSVEPDFTPNAIGERLGEYVRSVFPIEPHFEVISHEFSPKHIRSSPPNKSTFQSLLPKSVEQTPTNQQLQPQTEDNSGPRRRSILDTFISAEPNKPKQYSEFVGQGSHIQPTPPATSESQTFGAPAFVKTESESASTPKSYLSIFEALEGRQNPTIEFTPARSTAEDRYSRPPQAAPSGVSLSYVTDPPKQSILDQSIQNSRRKSISRPADSLPPSLLATSTQPLPSTQQTAGGGRRRSVIDQFMPADTQQSVPSQWTPTPVYNPQQPPSTVITPEGTKKRSILDTFIH